MSPSGGKGQQVAKVWRLAVHSCGAATRGHLLLPMQRLNDGQITRNDSAAKKILRFDVGEAFGVIYIRFPVPFLIPIVPPPLPLASVVLIFVPVGFWVVVDIYYWLALVPGGVNTVYGQSRRRDSLVPASSRFWVVVLDEAV
ncbi:hypothetical protein PGQ11_009466 [Apiospora arundinis]|uniref:Uncharacterized protein n=1 Tax=Apiospora arundinis TaxID=335852 RepID=A0ABR2II16_9PEZI